MKKTWVAWIAVLCFMISFVPVTAGAKTVASGTWNGDNVYWKLDSKGVLTLDGKRTMQSATNGIYPWSEYAQKVKTVIVEDGLESIGSKAFMEMKNLTSVYIADSVKEMGGAVFHLCEKLVNVVLPRELTVISPSTFSHCTSLESIYIPPSVTKIDSYAFAGCTSLKELHFAEDGKLHTIGKGAFKESGIEVLYTPSSLRTIEWNAFEHCVKLRAVYLQTGIETVKTRAFINCWAIRELYVAETVRTIDYNSFFGSNFIENITVYSQEGLEVLTNQSHLKCLTLGRNVTIVDKLRTYSKVLEKVILEPGITAVGDSAFQVNQSLKEVVFPDGLLSIGRAFEYSAVERLIIPGTVKNLNRRAFSTDSAVRELVFWGDAPTVEDNQPSNVPVNAVTIYYPANNPTWTQEVKEQFGENAVWIAVDCNGLHQPLEMPGTAATCERAGLGPASRCAACGTVLEEHLETEALGHDFGQWTELFAPTVGYYGMMERSCRRCHYAEQICLDPLNEPAPKPTDPKPTEPKPTEPNPTEPLATTPVETTPVETTPMATQPAETQPQETEPLVTDPTEGTEQGTEPDGTQPQTEPVQTDPAADPTGPEETQPVVDREPENGTGWVIIVAIAVLAVAAGGILVLKKRMK